MASAISYDGPNSGFQVGQNHGHITAHFLQSEISLNQACLRDLRTTDPHHDKDRIQNTNGGLLKDSYCWILDNEEFQQWRDNQNNCLLWIRGDPGKGKTMLLCGIIEELTRLFGDTANISFFFCQATDVRINNATAVLRGLIYSLVKKQPSLLSHVRSQYDQAGKALFEDINAWNALSRIFTDILEDPTLQSTYLMIDALDECTPGLPFLLDLIANGIHIYRQVKWIVSSRNRPDIEERLSTATHTPPILLELNGASISDAVGKFIQHKVHHLAKVKRYKDETRDTICRHLLLNSQETFLWVALVCLDLDRTSRRHALQKLKGFPPSLNALYGRMIEQVRNSEDADLCKQILAVMLIVYRPITFDELTSFIDLPDDLADDYETLSEIIAICGSFLTLREGTIIFVHQSAKEFLLREFRNEVFPRGVEVGHRILFSHSLQVMFKTLRRDIFNIRLPGFPIEKVRQPCPNPLAAAQYACVYWIDHLQHSGRDDNADLGFDVGERVDAFLQQKYLHWLEALSIMGSLSQGITAMLKLEGLLQKQGMPQALSLRVRDACRFIRYYRQAIESSPLQVYCAPLIFSPTQSTTRRCYEKESPDWVLDEPVVEKNWGPCLQTLEGHSGWIHSIVWLQDGSWLASVSDDNTVKIWDPATGQCIFTLEGHDGPVRSISWLQGGSRLASASSDNTVRIWDPTTGRCASTLKGHSGPVNSTAWTKNGGQLASASFDKTVKIWDPVTSQCILTLKGHCGSVSSISWLQDGIQLVSASDDKTIRIWDRATGQCESILEGHSGPVTSIAWSQDRSRLASASDDETVRIWDPVAGQCESVLKGHSNWVRSIAWSQDGSRLASASFDATVRIWDPVTGQCQSVLKGHSNWVRSIAWSQDGSRLASGSSDHIITIWDPATAQYKLTLEGHNGPVTSIAWLHDGSRLASGSSDNTVRIWDATTHQRTLILDRHTSQVNSIAWSQDGRRLASASDDNTVKIWDPATSQCVFTLEGHGGPVRLIAWFKDGRRLASGSDDNTVMIWDPTTGQRTLTLKGHSGRVRSIVWLQDGSRLASASFDNTVRIWNPTTGHCALTLEGHSGPVTSMTWSQDRRQLASASYDNTIRIWKLTTGQCVSTLKGHSDRINSVTWSQDGGRLASASFDATVRIWDPVTGQCQSVLKGHSNWVRSIAWSQDGRRLASGSYDNTIRIWDPSTSQCESAFPIESPYFLQFDELDLNYLHTPIGTFNVASTGSVTSTPHDSPSFPEQCGYGLNDDHTWITHNGAKLLWLPSDYRPFSPSMFAISATTVAICCSSGRVIFLVLSKHNPLSRL